MVEISKYGPWAVIAGGSGEVLLRVLELIGIEFELRLGDFDIPVIDRGGRRRIAARRCFGRGCRRGQGCGQAVKLRLILIDELLQFVDSLRLLKCSPCELAALNLDRSLPQGRSERLVHFVVGEALSLARIFDFLR